MSERRNWKVCAYQNAVVAARKCPEGALEMVAFPTKKEAEDLIRFACHLSRTDNKTMRPPAGCMTPEDMQDAFRAAMKRMRG